MSKFQLLKQTFPISQIERICDGYVFIKEISTKNERNLLGIVDNELQKTIMIGEKYLYRVGIENNKFNTKHISLSNFKIIRKHFYRYLDE